MYNFTLEWLAFTQQDLQNFLVVLHAQKNPTGSAFTLVMHTSNTLMMHVRLQRECLCTLCPLCQLGITSPQGPNLAASPWHTREGWGAQALPSSGWGCNRRKFPQTLPCQLLLGSTALIVLSQCVWRHLSTYAECCLGMRGHRCGAVNEGRNKIKINKKI